jgi:hypothetical protein
MATMSGASCDDDKSFRARVLALGINGAIKVARELAQ